MAALLPDAVRGMIGKQKTIRHLVTARDIKRFAQAIGETHPLHFDEAYAATTAYGAVVAPPLFCQTLTFEDLPIGLLPPDGSPIELDVPIPAQRAVGGGSEYRVHRLVRAGDVITSVSSLKDVSTRQGKTGLLYLIVVETRFIDQEGRPVAEEIATYIKRVGP